jgi:putative membrane protein
LPLSTALNPGLRPFAGDVAGMARGEVAGLAAAILAAVAVWWFDTSYPSAMPAWAPWDFSFTQFLAAWLALGWYARGVLLLPADQRPGLWRQAAFLLGLGAIYAVLLTHFEYMAQHMFFLNRVQHMAMHHLGPFLIAVSWPGGALLAGMPAPLRRALQSAPVLRATRIVQQPVIAGLLFVGLIYVWLIPGVHFHAMLDPRLYDLMNWSMVIDGLLFWSLVLDPRPAPPARMSYATRLILTILVMFPQIMLGASITFSTTSLYPYYDLCGRLFPSVGALLDQHIGGVILWIPSSMMSSAAFMLTLNNLRRHEDRAALAETDPEVLRMAAMASRWTGR